MVGGIGVGGGAAVLASKLLGPVPNGHASSATKETGFVTAGNITAPLVMADGRLSGYVSFDASLEVGLDEVERVNARLPLLRHAVNMQTYRVPMAAGPDGLVPNLESFRMIVTNAAKQTYGPDTVRFVAVTNAVPA